jgi:hypothetical protein
MLTLPFFQRLEGAERILIAGAGGGFDICCGLPLYFALRDAGKAVFLANLSFSPLPHDGPPRLSPTMATVTAQSRRVSPYFPELYLARWLAEHDDATPIYCLKRAGVRPLVDCYRTLVAHLGLDTIILVDGGTDSLMRGDEVSLGSPHEDISSMLAVDELEVARKLLVCLGFGVDRHDGVCHADFLEAVAELTRAGGYLGLFSLMQQMPEVQRYQQATEAVFQAMPKLESIVASSILSALEGHYGDYHRNARTRTGTLWINPLMAIYWCFELAPVARRILYREPMLATATIQEVQRVIVEFRKALPAIRPRSDIPV